MLFAFNTFLLDCPKQKQEFKKKINSLNEKKKKKWTLFFSKWQFFLLFLNI